MMKFWKVSLLTAVLLLCVNVLSADATTITFQHGGPNPYSDTQATYLYYNSHYPNHNFGNDGTMIISVNRRSLIKFTDIFGSDANQIQYGSSILSATLRFAVNNSEETTVSVHFVTTSWDESVTIWNTFGGGGGGTAGTDWEIPEISTTTTPHYTSGIGTCPFSDFNVTSAVSAWSSGAENNGLIFPGTNYPYNVHFCTEDYPTLGYRPELIVEYEENAVPEPLSIILLGLGLGISWFRKKFRNR